MNEPVYLGLSTGADPEILKRGRGRSMLATMVGRRRKF